MCCMGCRRDGGALRIEVHDTGPGIAEQNQAVIFQEFERLGQDKGTEPGLGLGLSIVERIAKMLRHPLRLTLDGRAVAHCSPSRFRSAARERARRSTCRNVSRRTNRIGGLTVLVIDNEPQILEAMRALLGGWGARVITARSAAEAHATSSAGAAPSIDAMLADYHLHRDDGLDLIERLRAVAGRPVPAILITADRSRLVQDRGRGARRAVSAQAGAAGGPARRAGAIRSAGTSGGISDQCRTSHLAVDAACGDDRLGAAADIELLQDGRDMGLDGRFRDTRAGRRSAC